MGAYLDKPNRDKFQDNGEGNSLRYGVASMQGWREDMEDSHVAKINLGDGLIDWSYFAVFDGHAGVAVSAYCAEHLLDTVIKREEFKDDVQKAIYRGCIELDNKMRFLPEMFYRGDKSGSTAIFAFISTNSLYIGNCGDSRAVLCRNGSPIFFTQDHTANIPSEQKRIIDAGGHVSCGRVNGNLAVSRALGDFQYKKIKDKEPCEQLVSSEPEVFIRERDQADEFLVLACDGIWDVMTNEELCAYIHSRLLVTNDLQEVTSQVIDTCLYKGSKDNMSIVLVVFPGAPSPTPEAIAADKELDLNIERRLKEIVEQNSEIGFYTVLQELKFHKPVEGLPPGGGLESKRLIIDNAFKALCPNVEIDKNEYLYKIQA